MIGRWFVSNVVEVWGGELFRGCGTVLRVMKDE